MPKRRTTILTILGVLLSATIYGQNPKVTYVAPFKISVNPPAFGRNQSVSATASFTAPTVCKEQGLLLRLYNIDDTTGEPTYDSKYLEETVAGMIHRLRLAHGSR